MKSKKILVIALALIILILSWSPWMADDGGEEIIRKVVMENPGIRGQVFDKNSNLLCDGLYSTWVPFGRWVSNCESGWYVTFWGKIF